jgi:hypothetical protein
VAGPLALGHSCRPAGLTRRRSPCPGFRLGPASSLTKRLKASFARARAARIQVRPGVLVVSSTAVRERGGTGRRAGFRSRWGNPWGFESPRSHPLLTRSFALHLLSPARGRTVSCQRLVNGTRRLLVAVAENQPRHRVGRLSVQAGQHVTVGVHGDGDVRVPEPLGDDLGGNAGGQRRGCIAVAHVVQPDLREAGRPGMLLEPPGEPLGVDGAAVRPGEHRAGVLPLGPTASRP